MSYRGFGFLLDTAGIKCVYFLNTIFYPAVHVCVYVCVSRTDAVPLV